MFERCALTVGLLLLACGGEQTDDETTLDAGNADATFDTGSADATGSTCDSNRRASTRISVCASPKTGPGHPANIAGIAFSGPVLAAGLANESSLCASSPYAMQGFWFEAADEAGQVWVLGASNLAIPDALSVGDVISVEVSREGGGFSPVVAALTVRNAESGELIVHASEAGYATALALPDGISAESGPAICTENDGCGEWSGFDLNVTVAGITQIIGYAKSANVGPYRVTHGGNELQAPSEAGTPCADWVVDHAAIGITPAH